MKLERRYIEKPWGRTSLPPMFETPQGKRIGEIWFTASKELRLLAKYIFTSEALSIQVHPNDEQARARGFQSGKAECWYILEAEPDARLGLGLTREVGAEEMRSAALDGSIEQLVHWQKITAGDFIFVPPGTIHAIGAGISLLEFQQNADVTYRLYDYGRPRELHLEEALQVATMAPFDRSLIRHVRCGSGLSLVDGDQFKLVVGSSDAFADEERWVMPIAGSVRTECATGLPGDILLVGAGERVIYEQAWALTGATA